MAKGKYYEYVEPKLKLVEGWARDGLTDAQIAKKLGISYTSFKDYKNKYPPFLAILKRGKEVIDLEVENALLKRALGYKYKEITKEQRTNKDTGKIEQWIKEVEKEVVPDTTAQIFWLKNRKRDKWSDRKEETEEEKNLKLEALRLNNEKTRAEINNLTGDNTEIEDTSEVDALLEGEANASN